MKDQIRTAAVMLALLTALTGVVYPLAVTAIAAVAFPVQAGGSLMTRDGQVIGSELIGQANADPRYFWPRPSATDYDTLPSGATNQGPTSAELAATVEGRRAALRQTYGLEADAALPADLLFASGSGLDPHISPEAARLQIARVAAARGFDDAQRLALAALVERSVEGPQLLVLGQPRVNVLRLNRTLDDLDASGG